MKRWRSDLPRSVQLLEDALQIVCVFRNVVFTNFRVINLDVFEECLAGNVPLERNHE